MTNRKPLTGAALAAYLAEFFPPDRTAPTAAELIADRTERAERSAAAMTETKFSAPSAPTFAEVFGADAPTYTRDIAPVIDDDGAVVIPGETETFDCYGIPRAAMHYATVGHYARTESPELTETCADGGKHGAVTYTAHGRPVGWVDAPGTAADAERSNVKKGRNKKGTTALVIRHGRTRRDAVTELTGGDGPREWTVKRLTESALVVSAREHALTTCAACQTARETCERWESHDERGYCHDCAGGCGCLPPLLGIETIAWESVIRGGLSTDTRRGTLNARSARADERITERRATLRKRIAGATTAAARERAETALQRAETTYRETCERIAIARRAMTDETYGIAGTCAVAVAHSDLLGALSPALASLPNDEVSALREHYASRGVTETGADDGDANASPGSTVRRITRWAPRMVVRNGRPRRNERPSTTVVPMLVTTPATLTETTAPYARESDRNERTFVAHPAMRVTELPGAALGGWVTIPDPAWQFGPTIRIDRDGTETETHPGATAEQRARTIRVWQADTAHVWHGHRLTERTETSADRKRATAARMSAVRTSNESCPIAVGTTETVRDGVTIRRSGASSFEVRSNGTGRRARTWHAAQRLAGILPV